MWGKLTFESWFESDGKPGNVSACVKCNEIPSVTCRGDSLAEAFAAMVDFLSDAQFEEVHKEAKERKDKQYNSDWPAVMYGPEL